MIVGAVLLTGGTSRRLGTDKATLVLDGETLAARAARALTDRTLPAVVYVADRLAAETGMGFRGDLLSVTLDPEVLDFLKLTKEAVDSLRNQVKAQAKDMANTLA